MNSMYSVYKEVKRIQDAMRLELAKSSAGRDILRSTSRGFTKAEDILYITVIKSSRVGYYVGIRVHHVDGMSMLLDRDYASSSGSRLVNRCVVQGDVFFLDVIHGTGYVVFRKKIAFIRNWSCMVKAIGDVYNNYMILNEFDAVRDIHTRCDDNERIRDVISQMSNKRCI